MKIKPLQTLLLCFSLIVLGEVNAQRQHQAPQIKKVEHFSFYSDKGDISLDSLNLRDFIKSEIFYNRQGQTTKTIVYPFQKIDYLEQIAKELHYRYHLDTTFILSKTVAGDLIYNCFSILQADSSERVYSKIYGDYSDYGVYTKNKEVMVREFTYTKNTAVVDITEYPLIPDGRDTVYREGMEDTEYRRVKLSSTGAGTSLTTTLYAEIIDHDTTQFILETVIKLDSRHSIKESLLVENSPSSNNHISKFVTNLDNGLKTSSSQYVYKNKHWTKLNTAKTRYNAFGDEILRIRESFNSINKDQRFYYLIRQYEYYE